MGKYRINTPDGHEYEIEGPDGASEAEVIAMTKDYIAKAKPGEFKGAEYSVKEPKVETSLTALASNPFGLGDEAAGAGRALANAVVSPFSDHADFDPVAAYKRGRDGERAVQEATRAEMPWVGAAAELAGNLGGTAANAVRGIPELVRQGLKVGAGTGLLGGWGYGEGFGGSVAGGAVGATLGAGLGAALPLAYKAIERPIRAGIEFMRPQNGVGRELVSRAMRQDMVRPSEAAQRIATAQENGVPLGLMDQGDNLRGLAAAVGRRPGASRTMIREAVIPRQMEQGERIRGAIDRDLGPIVNPVEQGDALIQQARTAAAPLYEKAYSNPGASSVDMADLAMRPSFRKALMNAANLAAEEGDNPMALGFQFDEAGDVLLTDVPSFKTMDYIKRGMDDVIEGYRDPTSGRLNLDGAGRAANDTLRTFIARVDKVNPDYAAARAAYAGPAREKSALDLGRKAVNASADEVARMTANLSPSEADQFALGHRASMAEGLDRKVDGANKVNALLGTPRKRQSLGQVYNGRGNLPRFTQTLGDEADAALTYQSVNGNSSTSERQLDDALISDQSMLEDVAGRAVRGAQGGFTGLAAEGVNFMRDINKFGAGASGQRARDEAAALLSNTDPLAWQEAMRASLRNAALIRMRKAVDGLGLTRGATALGRTAGGITGYSLRPTEQQR